MGLQISPLCDRYTTEVAKSQSGFSMYFLAIKKQQHNLLLSFIKKKCPIASPFKVKFLVSPMYDAFCGYFANRLEEFAQHCSAEADEGSGPNTILLDRPLIRLRYLQTDQSE